MWLPRKKETYSQELINAWRRFIYYLDCLLLIEAYGEEVSWLSDDNDDWLRIIYCFYYGADIGDEDIGEAIRKM